MNHEVISSVQDGIAMVTLNRPEAMNSMTVKLYDELHRV
ncbi:MAG: enoyl-CoA hydratase, partial [Chloroflexi bacterium CG07_land_8_20_14_0_80_51_10]